MENTLYELDKPLKLPDSLRGELQKVHGQLVSEDYLKNLDGTIITVGDVVTHTLLSMEIKPSLAIVDYKTKRGEKVFDDVKRFGDVVVTVRNPPGKVTPELWRAVREHIQSRHTVKIEVEGEEDLAVIPVVYFAEIGANVIYGMPNTGLVLLKVSEEDKLKVKELLRKMEV